jgi:hypothetical protein
MFKKIIISVWTLLPALSFSQEYKNTEWHEGRERISITPGHEKLPSLYLKDYLLNEYFEEEDDLYIYSTVHKIIRVNNDEGIQRHNRIYVPMYNAVELISIQARSISPSGGIQDLNSDNIKEIKDDETGNAFRIFAVEGLEAGSEVEYKYTAKVGKRYFGSEFVQESIPILNSEFLLICPEHLKFEFKGYNGYPQVNEEVKDQKRYYSAAVRYIPELENEEYSAYTASRMRVEYKLAFNFDQGPGEILTWNDATQRIYEVIYGGVSDLDKEAVQKFISLIEFKEVDIESKIRQIENYVKTHISIQEGALSDIDELAMIIARNYTNTNGIVRLFAAIFKQLEIDSEIVLTNGRDETGFDSEFENWNNLSEYLFYFPGTKKFLSPDKYEYRYGMVPFFLTDNNGLFIKTFSLGNFESAEGRVEYIPAIGADQSFDKMEIDMKFETGMSSVQIDFKRTMGGYNALSIQPYYSFIPENDSRTILEDFVRSAAEDAVFQSIQVENGEANLSPLDFPFIIKAKFTSSTIVEKAGSKILFKIGEIIGPQVEMYQVRKRVMPMENDYLRKYIRHVNFTIPDGYVVKNPDDINMEVLHLKDEKAIFGFTSNYTIEGNVLKLVCEEYYNELRCPVEDFEEFRKVINAAADFNKIVLVLEKK